jgi:hypothetical protein
LFPSSVNCNVGYIDNTENFSIQSTILFLKFSSSFSPDSINLIHRAGRKTGRSNLGGLGCDCKSAKGIPYTFEGAITIAIAAAMMIAIAVANAVVIAIAKRSSYRRNSNL